MPDTIDTILLASPTDREEADARLISAAPDMLLALRLMLADPYLSDRVNQDRPCVMAAIKAMEKVQQS